EALQRARAQLAQHVRVRAELVVREYLDVHATLRLGANRIGHLLCADVHRVCHRQVVRVLIAELRLLGMRAAEREPGGGARRRDLQELASLHLCFLPFAMGLNCLRSVGSPTPSASKPPSAASVWPVT